MTSKLEFNQSQSEEIKLIFQSLTDLSINFLELNTTKIESAKILVELNEALAKNGR